jgi:preprotein translocase subunit SecF
MLKYRKIYFTISGILVAISILSLIVFGLNLGIDFTGGSLLEVRIESPLGDTVTAMQIKEWLEAQTALNLGDVMVQPTDKTFLIRLRNVSEQEHEEILNLLQTLGSSIQTPSKESAPSVKVDGGQIPPSNNSDVQITELRFESIGPVIGSELKRKALWQLLLVAVGIVLYIAWAFRKVSQLKEKSKISWKFGLTALVTLLHDVIITLGVFAVLGKVLGVEIDNSFIAAILLVLGYSVNDTIVVFDRVRENLIRNKYSQDLAGIINHSISETIVRSLNTSTTTLLVLFAILIFGGSAIFYFILALIIGIAIGTYSSIFLASPMLYEWEKQRL